MAPGGDWSEANAGTNGIGTALATGRAVRVIGPEHFCDGWQDITCITVPIRTPQDGKIAGLLDISGDYHIVRPFFVGILTAAALEIKENLKKLSTPPPEKPHYRVLIPGKITENNTWLSSKKLFEPDSSNCPDLEKQLNSQEQRVFAAERLAIAIGSVSASLDLDTTLIQVAEQAAHLLELDHAAVCLFDDQRNISFYRAWSKTPSVSSNLLNTIKIIMEEAEVLNLLNESGEPLTIDDIHHAQYWPEKLRHQNDFSAMALLPLMGARNANGLILISSCAPRQWQPDDLRLELTFALHATTAIENARLFQSLQRHHDQVEALNAVNQMLHTLYDPAQQLNLMIKRIVEILGLDAGLILLNQGNNNETALSAHYGFSENALVNLLSLARVNIFSQKSLLICQLKKENNQNYQGLQEDGFCDVMTSPLTAGCDALGFLLVACKDHHDLAAEDLTLFTSIGQQLGLAFKNAQLLRSAGETQALREADRIKSRFLMMISHDLRSPLTAIRTSVESLLDKNGDPPAEIQEHLLRNIAGQAKRLSSLVDQLLDLLRIEAGALTIDRDWTELIALISDTVNKFERLNAPCKIKHNLTVDLPLVYIDPDRMVQVLWNLLENAYKYSPATSQISIEVEYQQREILIRVCDRGPGIPTEEHEKIFQYFYRLNREQQMRTPGSGLGLAICRGIMEAHGGRIWVEERHGGGSIFCVELPPSLIDSENLISYENTEFEQLPR
ncbi:MAG: ATP-binding protein [Anaerolineae bacterium]|nr:ATP-binding protein [Anaerolineae bacterium]